MKKVNKRQQSKKFRHQLKNQNKCNTKSKMKYTDYECYDELMKEKNSYYDSMRAMLNYVVNIDHTFDLLDDNDEEATKVNFRTMNQKELLKQFRECRGKINELNYWGVWATIYDWWYEPDLLLGCIREVEDDIEFIKERVDEANQYINDVRKKYSSDDVQINAEPQEKFYDDGSFTCQTLIEFIVPSVDLNVHLSYLI